MTDHRGEVAVLTSRKENVQSLRKTPMIPDKLYFKIGEVSQITGVKPYVLRYWESEFKLVSPAKSKSKQRLYKRRDIENILRIKKLLYEDRFTIAGAKKTLKTDPLRLAAAQMELGLTAEASHIALGRIREELRAIRDLLK
jgi:DNA-binding transcriptional MerR regulator